MASEIAITDMLLRLVAAAGLASVIGLERELRGRPAGLRTHMLVALGAAGFMLVGYEIVLSTAGGDPSTRVDPIRIVEGVITGIGFLGAGSIIQGRGSIQGLTTGAAIWIAGAIGIACAVGNFVLAGMITGLSLIVVVVLGLFEHEVIYDDDEEKQKIDSGR